MEQIAAEQPWAIVLAGGDGTRLQGLTRKIEGDSRPKQFSKVFGSRSLLSHTRERLRPVFSDDRIMFVVTKGHDRFCEKPPLKEVQELMKQGGLWNAFVTIGRAGAFLELLSTRVLTAVEVISDALAAGDLDTVYHEMDTIDFSKDVLSLDASNLLVVEDSTSGWADFGNPQRVIETLDSHQIEPDWLCEIRRANQPRLNPLVSSPHHTIPAFRNLVTVQ